MRWRPTNGAASSAASDRDVTTWRALRAEVGQRLSAAGIVPADSEARFLVEQASGYDGDEWVEIADVDAPARAEARLHSMTERRAAGEPLQYVMGAWSFRTLDLMVDPRVLIPRPETEFVVEVALEEAARTGLRRTRRRLALVEPRPSEVVVDLGTGSGAIALALEAELPDVEVWATDASDDALTVARANVAGAAAARVKIAPAASWFDALPSSLRGTIRLIVSNPPYVAEHELADLPQEVATFEPRDALVSGPRGTEALEALLDGAREWLAPRGTLVLELAPHQADEMQEFAAKLGYTDVFVREDLTGRPRVLVARTG
jgi:release factor glutamine methyltransferase